MQELQQKKEREQTIQEHEQKKQELEQKMLDLQKKYFQEVNEHGREMQEFLQKKQGLQQELQQGIQRITEMKEKVELLNEMTETYHRSKKAVVDEEKRKIALVYDSQLADYAIKSHRDDDLKPICLPSLQTVGELFKYAEDNPIGGQVRTFIAFEDIHCANFTEWNLAKIETLENYLVIHEIPMDWEEGPITSALDRASHHIQNWCSDDRIDVIAIYRSTLKFLKLRESNA